MEKADTKEAMKELTMVLMFLSRFTHGEKFESAKNFSSWKNYDFDIVNELEEENYIYQGKKSSKSVSITEEGKAYAKSLLEKYGINDWL